MRTSDWVKFSHVWWESVPQRFPKQTMQSLKGSSVVFPPIKNMYAKIAHTPDTVHDGMPGTSHDCIVHHILCTIFWICIAAHIAKKGDQRFGCIEQGPSTLYMSNIQKKQVKCTAGAGRTGKMFEDYTLCQGEMDVPRTFGLPTIVAV